MWNGNDVDVLRENTRHEEDDDFLDSACILSLTSEMLKPNY